MALLGSLHGREAELWVDDLNHAPPAFLGARGEELPHKEPAVVALALVIH